ncbi:hypothetical protein CUMW_272300 [Citrus unshiu]|uniref:TIR domain-containing protein n=1 Tax=Citrus unshiu TaxID=55188 RepID=A0A2H5MW96_CITUN|nr:hypothetical protein CUMW_272300 [Citrus unshiu]
MASSSFSSSHPHGSLTNPEIKYDVFLSFGGEDTWESFTSHLYSALSRESIETFIDNDLRRGDEISQSFLDAIEASSISVIIFLESHASSRWCLNELLKILKCKKEYAHIVTPVFYRVDLSYMRKETGLAPNLDNLKGAQDFCFENGKHEWQGSTINKGAIIH